MKKRALVMLAFALVLGLASVVMLRQWIGQQLLSNVKEQAKVETTTIVVARASLSFGNRIGREHIQEVAWPAHAIPPGSFAKVDELIGGSEARVVLRPIEPNEPILAGKITGPGGRATLSTVVDPDMRAVTIRVNDVQGVAGFVLPGDRVDVLVTRPLGGDRDRPITDVLLQNIKVLGIDQDANERKDKPVVAKAATVEVTPDQAQKLTLAAQVGTLSLALRNHADMDPAPVRTIGLSDLSTQGPAPKAGGAPSDTASIRVLRGTTATEQKVHREGTPRPAATPSPSRTKPPSAHLSMAQ